MKPPEIRARVRCERFEHLGTVGHCPNCVRAKEKFRLDDWKETLNEMGQHHSRTSHRGPPPPLQCCHPPTGHRGVPLRGEVLLCGRSAGIYFPRVSNLTLPLYHLIRQELDCMVQHDQGSPPTNGPRHEPSSSEVTEVRHHPRLVVTGRRGPTHQAWKPQEGQACFLAPPIQQDKEFHVGAVWRVGAPKQVSHT